MASSTTTRTAIWFILSTLRLIPLLLPLLLVRASFFRFRRGRIVLVVVELRKRDIVDLDSTHMVINISIACLLLSIYSA